MLWVLIRIASLTHNIGFYEEIAKIIFQLSSNTHFVCSYVQYTITVKKKKTLQNSCETETAKTSHNNSMVDALRCATYNSEWH